MKAPHFLCVFLIGLMMSCTTQTRLPETGLVEFTILQINDVYEIAPIEGGAVGGLARVAQLKKELKAENPNTIAVLAGDFLSPSLIATLKVDGERIAGLQMVETLNEMGLDYATFGNHEFDISDPDLLQKRIHQSAFQYMSCNVMRVKDGKVAPFTQMVNGAEEAIPPYVIHEFKSSTGGITKVAIIGVVLPFNKQDYLQYLPLTESFRMAYEAAQQEADLVLALTHLNMEDDIELAKDVPGIPLFLGGHEHVNLNHYIEETIITKADANAKTAYVHHFTFDPKTKLTRIKSTVKAINKDLKSEENTQKVVDRWQNQVNGILEEMGYEPDRKLMEAGAPLVCTEALIRTQQTNFGQLTCRGIQMAFPAADVCFVNSGSMRLDDNLSGTIVEYDILRTYPFGGAIVQMEVPGKDLQTILNIGLDDNYGEGGYFQILGVTGKRDAWQIKGVPLDLQKKYTLALPQFVAEGKEARLGILANFEFEKPEQLKIGFRTVPNDIRNLVIAYMQN